MLGLFKSAQTYRLLFQHHTTPLLCREHKLFGHEAQNSIAQMGPRLAAVITDGRTERNHEQIQHPESWKMIFERLNKLPETTQHLLAVFAVPFSFIRVKLAEKIFEFLKNRAPWVRHLPGIKGSNSIFGLPERKPLN